MSKISWKGSTLLSPVPPAMVTCGDMEHSNIITIAWTGILNSQPPKTYISVRPQRFSHKIISETREFVINLTTAELVRHADFCGVRSGRDLDKFALCGLHKETASQVQCPILAESPLALECRVTDIIPLGSHDMFIADILAVDAEESLLDADGRLCMERASLAAYAHGDYYALGRKLGDFGFSVRKKSTARRNGTQKRKKTATEKENPK